MTLNVGVIGVGMIGQDHIRRLTKVLAGANVVAVSDAYHIFRIKRLMRRWGIVAYGSPRPGSVPHTASAKILAVLRESASYVFWRLYPSWFPQ